MNAIWKFPLTSEETEIEAPIEQFLTVQIQNDVPCIWAIVNPDRIPRKFKVMVLGTGWEYQKIDPSKYIGTFQSEGHAWHCFWENVLNHKNVQAPVFTMFSSH